MSRKKSTTHYTVEVHPHIALTVLFWRPSRHSFRSAYTPVQVPVAVTTTTSGSSCTVIVTSNSSADNAGSSKHEVSTSALGAVAGVLGLITLMALAAALIFWRRDHHSREQLKWAMEMSTNATTPFTTFAAPPKPSSPSQERQAAAAPYDPWEGKGHRYTRGG